MNTAEKLLKAFEQFRPHINGHKTAIDLFFEAVKEVEDLQKQVKKLTLADVSQQRELLLQAYKGGFQAAVDSLVGANEAVKNKTLQ